MTRKLDLPYHLFLSFSPLPFSTPSFSSSSLPPPPSLFSQHVMRFAEVTQEVVVDTPETVQ